jgi:protein TonB
MALTKANQTTSVASGNSATPQPPPPPGAPGASAAPVRVGGNIKAPTKIQHVSPVYPQEAQDARVTGVVIIEATINPEGSVETANVLRSIPMLDQAALEAVKQWRFTPTLLNGVPVPVIMTVTVNFTLQ